MWVSHFHPKRHIPKPIPILRTSLLGFHPPSRLTLPISAFQMSSEPSCSAMLLPDSFGTVYLELGELCALALTNFSAAFSLLALTLIPAPFPVYHIISKIMFYAHLF